MSNGDFPDACNADEHGIVAIGGRATPNRLLEAYRKGIFPWPTRGLPLLWFSPNPRFYLPLEEFRLGRSVRRLIAKTGWHVSLDETFDQVITSCASIRRHGEEGTWITRELVRGFGALHRQGLAHSVEVWNGKRLIGGLYGLSLGAMFFGESMFSVESGASKVAFASLVAQLQRWNFDGVDCQVETEHLGRFGARNIDRDEFLSHLAQSLTQRTRQGRWKFATNRPQDLLEHELHGVSRSP